MSLKIYPNCHFIYDENCPRGDGGGGSGSTGATGP